MLQSLVLEGMLAQSVRRPFGVDEDGGYCTAPHLVRRWREEADYAEEAKRSNEVLLAFSSTRFKVGDDVLLEGRSRVRITAVQPVGFITVPRKYGNLGRLLPAVVCDVEIYQYRGVSPGSSATGQTSVDRLSPLR